MACCSLAFFRPRQRLERCLAISNCKYSSTSILSNPLCLSQDFEFSSPKHVSKPSISLRLVAHPHVSLGNSSHGTPKETLKYTKSRTGSMSSSSSSSSSRPDSRMVDKKPGNPLGTSLVEESGFKTDDGETRKSLKVRKKNPKRISEFSLDRALDGSYPAEKSSNGKIGNIGIKNRKPMKGEHTVRARELMRKSTSRRSNKGEKTDPVDMSSRIKLDMCSKTGNVMGAISFYDTATRDGMKLGQYHYTVLLYLCSSAAMGVIRPAKSGSGNRSLGLLYPVSKGSSADCVNGPTVDLYSDDEREQYSEISTGKTQDDDDGDKQDCIPEQKNVEIQVSVSEKHYALKRGLEIYERMRLENIPMNEAALTSVARMAMAMGDGDMAFDMVKQMKKLGINPKLRSYGPALSVFCSNGEIDKAFEVEKHMLECGVNPEGPELEALLKVSIDVNKAEKIYYLLHKLRVKVRSVLPCTADLIERWFRSKEASRVGKRKWNPEVIRRVIESGGGGWHGQGWLGSGKWFVSRTLVGADGFCRCCGEKLALIDLDPKETEMFAESVASIAKMKERNSSFQKFQRWLDYYGPFEAVVDAANVGLFNQKKFRLSRVKAVVNGIRQMLSSKKWPLLVLHNRHLTDHKMDKPANKAITEKWRYADALYATPTGSNDDWYWLYAAIRFRCLIVTNDEMRDHTFQLLGSDFFTKWKERHQVRFSFSEIDPVFHMPPPCSVVIQESDRGHWHIPIVSEHQSEGERTWLCVTRGKHSTSSKKDPGKLEESEEYKGPEARSVESSSPSPTKQKYFAKQAQKTYRDLLSIISPEYRSILTDIEDAEDQGGCVIDFQI